VVGLVVAGLTASVLVGCSSSKKSDSGSSGAASGSSSAAALTTIRVPETRDASALDVLVAVDQGYMKAHGINAVVSFQADGTTNPQTTGHQYEITSVVATQLIAADAGGLSLVAVSSNRLDTTDNPTAGLIVGNGTGITSYKDLVGKTIGTPSVAGTLMLCTLAYVKQQGGDPTTVKPVQAAAPQLGDLLSAKRFQAVTAVEPVRSQLVSQGLKDLGDPYRYLGAQVASTVYIATRDWAQAHPTALAGWRAALAQADAYIAAHPDYAKNLLVQKAGISQASVQSLKLAVYSPTIPTGTLQGWAGLMQSVGTLKKQVDVSTMIAP
jgi:ABC-type nitrate/sulfonate/bicarbonate transport system substrate-binding protein